MAGFKVLGAVEVDGDAAASYKLNHSSVQLWEEDVRAIDATEMMRNLGMQRGELTLLKACPPCQGFSSLAANGNVDEARNDLVLDTVRFIRVFLPLVVL